jgi:hypothetical protein
MLPQGTIWQELRRRALDTVQPGCAVGYSLPPTLEKWLKVGAFNVSTVTKRGFALEAASVEIGSALLSEAFYSADYALEHSTSLRNQIACNRWSSPAWTAVTFYYWGYHLAVAMTRLLGRAVWFISPELTPQLKSMAGSGTASHGPGPYVVECGTLLSATLREIRLVRSSQTRAHDAVWQVWFSELRKCAATTLAGKPTSLEARLHVSLIRAANVLGDSWPSDLRNALNYTIKSGYGAVRGEHTVAVHSGVNVDPPSTVSEMISRLEGNAASLVPTLSITDQLPIATRTLVDTTFAMEILLRELLDEITQRRGIDRRWTNTRVRFARLQAERFGVRSWPCREDSAVA